jgi:hypothetical protein
MGVDNPYHRFLWYGTPLAVKIKLSAISPERALG